MAHSDNSEKGGKDRSLAAGASPSPFSRDALDSARATAEETPPLTGAHISHYHVLERLGGGGMGVVYKAWDKKLERYAALKFLSDRRSRSVEYKSRFRREARTASILEHPNICTIFETDETPDGRLFIAMAFCPGESLKSRIERGPLALDQAVSIAVQVAAGLAEAHEKGVVHRDVKPANIMVGGDGRTRIVDFGIARLDDQTRLTRAGDVLGTTAYVAPEQFLEEVIDHRVDLWSLGVVLYEMLSGALPFASADNRDLAIAIVKREPAPLAALRPGVPKRLESIVTRALAKRPAERYQSAEELRNDLAALLGAGGLLAVAAEVPGGSQPPHDGEGWEPTRQAPLGAWHGTGQAGAAEPGVADAAPPRGTGMAPPAAAAMSGAGAPGSAGGPSWIDSQRPAAGAGFEGRTISHYQIHELLGGGGMGVVYRAEDVLLNRTVALKFLPSELTRDPEAKSRFLQEARSASALDHPNICTIHEIGETDQGQLFLAMACYDGESLKKRLARGPLPIEEAVDIAQQTARGLVKAHRHGIVHRDIKPANLMITSDDIVKIVDFGIAKLAGAAGLTRTGSSLGTPGYMSPEQARGHEVDPRTDLWSLGAVLYEMVTGRRPFRGEHEQAVLYALYNEEPQPLAELRPDAPPELARIIGRMLAKDPDQRYPSAAEALADLRTLLGPSTGTLQTFTMTRGLEPPARRRRWLIPAVAAAALLLAAAAVFLLRQPAKTAPARLQPKIVRLTDLEGQETFPSISPDGKYFVYVKSVGGRSSIFSQRVGGGNPVNLSLVSYSTADDTEPAYSPDGDQIAFRSERDGGGIFIMGATGESVRRLTASGGNPAWSPDGSEIVYADASVSGPSTRPTQSKLWRVRVSGGEPHILAAADAVQPSWSPHGQRIAYWSVTSSSAQRTIFTIPAIGGKQVPVTNDSHLNWNPVWSPEGRYLYFASDRSGTMNLWRVPIEEESGRVLGEPEPVTTSPEACRMLSVSKDGHRILYATDDTRSNLERIAFNPGSEQAEGQPSPVTQGPRLVRSGDVSPDGNRIVFDTYAPQEDLFIIHPDGSGLRRLTDDHWKNRGPRWSPDGSRIVFYSNRSGYYEAWTIHPDGSRLQQITTLRGALYNPIFSPDGSRLSFELERAGSCILDLTKPFGKTAPVPLPVAGGAKISVTAWSPDGTRLAGPVEGGGVFVYSFASATREIISRRGLQGGLPAWLSDSQRLLYIDDGKVVLFDLRTKHSHEIPVPPRANSTVTRVRVSPDNRFIYLIRTAEEGDIWMLALS
ncbi:MAG TPA: protein kinase [Thermoanaerobaculia bacterium]|nr:protein kinase [Thermoanaerobaculia bacterium]